MRRVVVARIGFERGFLKLRDAYEGALHWVLTRPAAAVAGFLAFALLSLALYPFVGRDFFPVVDAGQLRLHVRGPAEHAGSSRPRSCSSRSRTTSAR